MMTMSAEEVYRTKRGIEGRGGREMTLNPTKEKEKKKNNDNNNSAPKTVTTPK